LGYKMKQIKLTKIFLRLNIMNVINKSYWIEWFKHVSLFYINLQTRIIQLEYLLMVRQTLGFYLILIILTFKIFKRFTFSFLDYTFSTLIIWWFRVVPPNERVKSENFKPNVIVEWEVEHNQSDLKNCDLKGEILDCGNNSFTSHYHRFLTPLKEASEFVWRHKISYRAFDKNTRTVVDEYIRNNVLSFSGTQKDVASDGEEFFKKTFEIFQTELW